ncbi:hypothetical protein SAMN06265348_104314 [Pedobacter westerhofensis]|uniref:Uncharacterized protein n=1 Tax=Pedobacter westerhofensis TaxID=425512 RepID=A0A521CYQ6_9SPHI|nr:hypothetical protein [Pedobacter westerhofensis]SMO64564.1 hypothetical protein SAMN06265348_104314 [Pedobacter westerhofensis]
MKRHFILLVILSQFLFSVANAQQQTVSKGKEPKIINIVNFIRDIEPRDAAVTKDVLYQTVVKQIELMKQYHLGGTFLLQYDALIDKRYQELLKALPGNEFEIGGWWELPQPLIEKAGIKWRGKYAWDWHSDVGFSVGYTPAEREKIIDVYFADFKAVFGYYPKSIAAWVIDAHSLNYMYNKYKIVASANCKDQVGTDGFTLWGGYWNQAYYPSKINAYMPAQQQDQQIPVPVFRMLGSDPIRQYADGSTVTTLEPVYPYAGGNEQWINWFFKTFANDPALGFNYTQAGQENSFTWDAMKKGLEWQMPIIANLKKEGKVRVETMEQSGAWFSKQYKVTPATTFTVSKDLGNSDQKTMWYNSRFYRINLLWEKGMLRITDIHLFNEQIPDKYLKEATTTNQSFFYTLPVVDGFQWGKAGHPEGFRLMANEGGSSVPVQGGDPVFTNVNETTARAAWPLAKGSFEFEMSENAFTITAKGKPAPDWFLELYVADKGKTAFQKLTGNSAVYEFHGHSYKISPLQGRLEESRGGGLYRVYPKGDRISFRLADTGGKELQ